MLLGYPKKANETGEGIYCGYTTVQTVLHRYWVHFMKKSLKFLDYGEPKNEPFGNSKQNKASSQEL